MVGWHPQLNGHEFKQIPGENDGQASLVCCSPWGHKELDTTERMNNNKTPDYHIPLNSNACSSEQPSLATLDTVDPCFKTFHHVIKVVWHDMYYCLNFLLMNLFNDDLFMGLVCSFICGLLIDHLTPLTNICFMSSCLPCFTAASLVPRVDAP